MCKIGYPTVVLETSGMGHFLVVTALLRLNVDDDPDGEVVEHSTGQRTDGDGFAGELT